MKKRLLLRRLILVLCTAAALGLFTAAALADTEVSTWAELQAAFNEGGSVKLTRTVKASSSDGPLVLPSGKTVILDLAGKNIDRGMKDYAVDGYVIRNEGTLTVVDSVGGSKITGGYNKGDGGGIYNIGTLNLRGSTVYGNQTFILREDSGGNGGGIYNVGTMTMTEGSSVVGNKARDDSDGGGIYNVGTLIMQGGSIMYNESTHVGGGVYQNGTMIVSGTPAVHSNIESRVYFGQQNIYLPAERMIEVGGALDERALMRVYSTKGNGIFTTGYSLYNSEAPGKYFRADKKDCSVILVDGEASVESIALEVPYVKRSWDGTKVVSETVYAYNVRHMPGDGVMTEDLYYVNRNVTVDGRISVTHDTELILGDGCKLDVKGLYVKEGCTLTIYGQAEDKGEIYSHPSGGAAIGGYSEHDNGNIVIHGGKINATGYDNCAGIGTNDSRTGGSITIYGGSITAIGGEDGAGIGGGENCSGGTITIYGGNVTAYSKSNGAGIGGGKNGDGGTITIHGGTVTVNETDTTENGAGIGGGDMGNGGNITINGGTVKAWSRDGACIGGGDDGEGGNITITGGTITCRDEGAAQGARIGGGSDADGGRITITGGTIDVYFRDGAGIGGGEDADGGVIVISGGTVTTHPQGAGNGAGIGGGNHAGDGGNITITGGKVYANSTHGAGIGGGRAKEKGYDADTDESGDAGTITITGGVVRAHSPCSFGIGAGGQSGGNTFHVYVFSSQTGSGGTITLGGNADIEAYGCPAGIGGDGGSLYIKDNCKVTAGADTAEHNVGLGIYYAGKTAYLEVSGGQLTAIATDPGKDNSDEEGAGWAPAIDLANSDRTTVFSGGTVIAKSPFGKALRLKSGMEFAYYADALFTAGDSEGTARKLTKAERPEAYSMRYKYLKISPCGHEERDERGECVYCGDLTTAATYIERGWDGEKVTEELKDAPENTMAFPESDYVPAGWYYLDRDITLEKRVYLMDDTHLILGDGFTLDVMGLYIPGGSTLYIYGQSADDSGKIYSHPSDGAAIGGYSGHNNGNIVIHGGTIEAKGANHCAGIGRNDAGTGGSITIYGGTVTAKGGGDGAGIGGGRYCSGGSVTIYGGDITAKGGGSNGAGIGGGEGSAGGKIDIYGGTITANEDPNENGAGIGGGGGYGDGGYITINGGTVTVYSRDGAGIGGGDDGEGGTITINGGTITSTKVNQGQGARIGGGCDGAPGTIVINGGSITTVGGSGAGIGGGKRNTLQGSVTINGGVINASGSYGIGSGEEGANIGVTLNYTYDTRETISVTASSFNGTVTLEKPFGKYTGDAGEEPTETFLPGGISDNSLLAGGTLKPWDGEISSWQALQMAIIGASDGATITLQGNVTAVYGVDGPLTVGGEKNITIDLNGYAIDRNLTVLPDGQTAPATGYVIKNEGKLTVTDSAGGGTITGGNCSGDGGGIYNSGTLTLSGGAITGNASASRGGGVWLSDDTGAVLHLNGGSVTGNTCGAGGGGVYVSGTASMTVSVSPAVSGNTENGNDSNIMLEENAVIEIAGALDDGADLGVSCAAGATVITGGWSERMGDADPSEVFSSDDPDYIVTLTAEGEAQLSVRPTPRIAANRLILTGVLGLKYYMELPEGFDYTDSVMTFSVPNREDQVIPLSEAETDAETGYRIFECRVYAYQMADTITASFTYKEGGEEMTLTDEYSVRAYLESVREGGYSDAAKELVDAVWNYGHFIQPYLARTNGWVVGEKYAEMPEDGAADVSAAISGAAGYAHMLNAMNGDVIAGAQYRLTLNADTVLTVEVKLKAAPTDTVVMKVNGSAVTPAVAGRTYRVTIGGIAANNLAVPYDVTMEIGGETVFDFTASPLSFVNTVLPASEAEDERNALAALYAYWQAAYTYAEGN